MGAQRHAKILNTIQLYRSAFAGLVWDPKDGGTMRSGSPLGKLYVMEASAQTQATLQRLLGSHRCAHPAHPHHHNPGPTAAALNKHPPPPPTPHPHPTPTPTHPHPSNT